LPTNQVLRQEQDPYSYRRSAAGTDAAESASGRKPEPAQIEADASVKKTLDSSILQAEFIVSPIFIKLATPIIRPAEHRHDRNPARQDALRLLWD
jgi:hypothetical protein